MLIEPIDRQGEQLYSFAVKSCYAIPMHEGDIDQRRPDNIAFPAGVVVSRPC
jgi:hypothetical protein